ncbi:MAG: hypothetical protein JWQ72_3834 [Polaromonas sp.]|nr:hypothetical protein [Polaromonas sp.]
MPRFARNSAILAKIETTEGTDAVPTGSVNALLVSNQSINPLNAQNVDRDLIRNYFGASEQLVGTATIELSFTVELAGSGAAGSAAPWGELLRACGFIESGTVTWKGYQPDTPANAKSATIYFYDDGVLHKLLGARGNVKPSIGIGARPVLEFSFIGRDGGITAAANPTTTLTGWKQPLVVTDTNTGDIKLGGTYASGIVTGGTAYPSRGLMLDVGNKVQFNPLLGGEYVDITDRDVTGSLELDLTAAQEVTFMTSLKANTLQALSLEHGSTAGGIVGIYLGAAQLINPKKTELNGRRLIGYDLRSVPVAGNDDIVIYCK